MREQVAALLDERLRRGGLPHQLEQRRVAAEVTDHVHELGDGVHGMVVARATFNVAVVRKPASLPDRYAIAMLTTRCGMRTAACRNETG